MQQSKCEERIINIISKAIEPIQQGSFFKFILETQSDNSIDADRESDLILKFNESKRKALAHMKEKGLSLDIIATEFNCTVEEIEFILTLIDKK